MNWLKEHEADSWILKGAIVFFLLFPAFYSPYTDVYQSAYYAGFSWAYFMMALYMAIQVWKKKEKIWPLSGAALVYFAGLLVYNLLSLYFNHKYLHWYWEQVNNTVAFVLFAVLAIFQVRPDEGKQDNVRFLLHCIVISNAASLVYYLMGYTKFMVCNNQFIFFELPGDFYESRHYWIYSHKSEYALMLVAFIALFIAYRKKFRSTVTFALSTALLLVCLYLTHSWTGIAGVFLIIIGSVLDQVDWKHFKMKKWYYPAAGGFLVVAGAAAYKLMAERNIMNLGNRVPIWKSVWQIILKHPEGWGLRFGESVISVDELGGFLVNNAHNVFFNQMLRFSIPVGIVFTLLFLEIVIYTLVKGRSFLLAGPWAALLVLLDMDYALMSSQMALLFLVVWLITIYKAPIFNRK